MAWTKEALDLSGELKAELERNERKRLASNAASKRWRERKRMASPEFRTIPFPLGSDMKPTDAAWLAGFIDADGSIGLHLQRDLRKGPDYASFRPAIQITQVHRRVLEHVRTIVLGGAIVDVIHANPNARGQSIYSLRRQPHIQWVLEQILPYLQLKQTQAGLLLQFCRNRSVALGSAPFTPGDEFIYQQLKELNRTGVHHDD